MEPIKEPLAFKILQYPASEGIQSVPHQIRPRRSRETNYTPPAGDRRRRGFVLADQEEIRHRTTSRENLWLLGTRKKFIRREYLDCWWASNTNTHESEDLEVSCLEEHSTCHSPSPVDNSSPGGDFCLVKSPTRNMSDWNHHPSLFSVEADHSSFSCRKKMQLQTPSPAGKTLYYNDHPLPPPSCPLPLLPSSSDNGHSTLPETPARSTIKNISSAISKALDHSKPTSPPLHKYLRRPISFVTPDTQKKKSLASSLPAAKSTLSLKKSSRSCITPELKRTGNSANHSVVRPTSNTQKSPGAGTRWNLSARNTLRRGSPGPHDHSIEFRSSSESLDDPFKADPVIIQRSHQSHKKTSWVASDELFQSRSPEIFQSRSPVTPTNEIVFGSCEGSTEHSTSPSSFALPTPCLSTKSCTLEPNIDARKLPRTNSTKRKTIQISHEKVAPVETFIFAPLRRLDGFFGNYHRRSRTGPSQGAFTIKISPGPSNTTFSPGSRLKLSLIPGQAQFEEIRVSLIGSTRLRQGREVHEFVRVEKVIVDKKEMMTDVELRIPLRRSCRCLECDETLGVLPDSFVNDEMFVSYHLNIRGIKKARWTRDERVQVSLMVNKGFV